MSDRLKVEWTRKNADALAAELTRLRAEHAEMAVLLAEYMKNGYVNGNVVAALLARIQGEAPPQQPTEKP